VPEGLWMGLEIMENFCKLNAEVDSYAYLSGKRVSPRPRAW
jgi:hypothetical protein